MTAISSTSSTTPIDMVTAESIITKSIVFLDIDGVLSGNNNHAIHEKVLELFPHMTHDTKEYNIAATHLFKPEAVKNLETLIKMIPNTFIVLSSNWRTGRSIVQSKEILSKHAFSKLIIDKTPEVDEEIDEEYCKYVSLTGKTGRAEEIKYWLKKHPEITNFVILDDCDEDLSKEFPKNFVHVDAQQLLSENNIKKAAKILTLKRNDSGCCVIA